MSRGEARRDPCESIAKRDKGEAASAKPKPKANPDVAKHFNKPSLATAGWYAAAKLTALPGGSYAVRVSADYLVQWVTTAQDPYVNQPATRFARSDVSIRGSNPCGVAAS